MAAYDWSTFTLRIPVKVSKEKAYAAWTSQASLENWFLRKAEFKQANGKLRDKNSTIEAGDTYEWMWQGWDDKTVERDKVLELNGKDFVKFGFGKAGVFTVTISEELGETIVTLTQEQIPTDEQGIANYHIGCLAGWSFHLADLKSILEGGIDLRNKNVNLRNVLNA